MSGDTHPLNDVTDGDSEAITYTRDAEETPSRSVVAAVAAVTGSDPRRMDPLVEAVDPEALDDLVEPRSATRANARVTFQFNGCLVTVHGDGRTVVSPPETD
jgi:hypothetical protein